MKDCRPVLLTLVVVFLVSASTALGGTIASFKPPSEVREITLTAMTEWLNQADAPTGCGGGDCCPDQHANVSCTGAGAPFSCCTGAGAGTCNDEACLAFAETIRQDLNGWADDVEVHYQHDGDWFCNSWPERSNVNIMKTGCTTTSGTPVVDVSRILSEIGGRRHGPSP